MRESAGGFLRLYITRIDRMDYIKRKTVQIYAGGFLTLFLAGAAALTFCFLGIYPLELKGVLPGKCSGNLFPCCCGFL